MLIENHNLGWLGLKVFSDKIRLISLEKCKFHSKTCFNYKMVFIKYQSWSLIDLTNELDVFKPKTLRK
jgi:hypothetical protein